ncbi:MAG TPA: ATP-grasp domain-containing protein [Vicinamibacterales bacterium]|nr:ATP-grasp domain-containing protein [Vicinamibacterales bacterium]
MRPLSVFVTDGEQRPALAIARSLGRRGVEVVVGAAQSHSLASASKYCIRHVRYPSPHHQPDAFDRFLLDFVGRERVDVVLPVTDVTTHLVAKKAAAINRFAATALPSFDAFDSVSDKATLLRRAAASGVPIPRTLVVENRDALPALLDQIACPVVVKPARSRIRTGNGWLATSVHYARDRAELLQLYRDVTYLDRYPSMIQQRIVGPGTGVFVLCDRGRLCEAFAHRRLREKPPSGGVSVLCESIALDHRLVDHAMRLLAPLGWHGLAMVEFKQDRDTGRAYLMEVNGRFWGSLQLAIDAGIDFPYLCCQLALREPLPPRRGYEVGVKSRWLLGDLDHLFIRMFHGERDQQLPDGMPSRRRALCEFLRLAGARLHYDVISRDDPRPFLHEVRQYARQLAASAIDGTRKLFEPQCIEQESRHVGVLK